MPIIVIVLARARALMLVLAGKRLAYRPRSRAGGAYITTTTTCAYIITYT
jgi:hypothetical protein